MPPNAPRSAFRPCALDAAQVAELIELIKAPPAGEESFLLELLTHRVPPGVDDAAKVKASFLAAVAHGDIEVDADLRAPRRPNCSAPWSAATTSSR